MQVVCSQPVGGQALTYDAPKLLRHLSQLTYGENGCICSFTRYASKLFLMYQTNRNGSCFLLPSSTGTTPLSIRYAKRLLKPSTATYVSIIVYCSR